MANAKKLNQVLAVEKGVKTKAQTLLTEFHHKTQKDELLLGLEKSYQPVKEDGAKFPPESKRLQLNSKEVFKQISETLTELFDVTATKDWANCHAKADVVVDGTTLLVGVPSTYLLFLDKQLTDLQTFISKFSELSADKEWEFDPKSDTYRTKPVETVKTEKLEDHIVVVQPTVQHPAQVVKAVKDVVAGHWNTTYISGALPRVRKQELLVRVTKLIKAVKEALEEANGAHAAAQQVGEKVFNFLFA